MAIVLILLAVQSPLRIMCCRETQKSIKDSVKELIENQIKAMGLQGFFRSLTTEIRGKNGSRFLFEGLREHTVDTIKSKEGVDIAWVEEAHTVSKRSLEILTPTIRKEGSQIWFSWNPESRYDPVDMMFRGKHVPPDSVVKMVTYGDNPWFPDVLRKEMEFDKETDPEKFEHIWLGGYRKAKAGAYYAKGLAKARADGRIGHVPHDPGLEVHVSFDLGIGKTCSFGCSNGSAGRSATLAASRARKKRLKKGCPGTPGSCANAPTPTRR